MSRSETCVHCTAPVRDGVVLCATCRTTTSTALANIASYHADLLALGGPQARGQRRPGAVSDPTGGAVARRLDGDELAERDPADYAAADTRAALAAWVRVLVEEHATIADWPADTVAAMATFLGRHLASIATMAWVGNFVREVLDLEARLRRIVQRNDPRWYVGVCSVELEPERLHDGQSCGCACHGGLACDVPGGCHPEVEVIDATLCSQYLYAVPGSAFVRCPACHAHHSVAERRSDLLERSRDEELTLKEIAQLCAALLDTEPSVTRLLERLKKWTLRGQLVWVDNSAAVRLYRVGDVLDLLARHAADPRGWEKRAKAG